MTVVNVSRLEESVGWLGRGRVEPEPPGVHRSNLAPLREATSCEVLADRARMFLECGHAVEVFGGGVPRRVRCVTCLSEGRVR